MARRFRRPQPILAPKPKIVIACEGAKTERLYLNDLKTVNRLTSVEIIFLEHEGTDPRTIVRQVATRVREERRAKAWNAERDAAWAVFDGEEHCQTPGQLVNWNAAIQQARDLKINLALSNPSFEFWYLLHFQDYFRSLTRHEALRLLRDHLPSYQKSDRVYIQLQPLTNDAMSKAEDLRQRAERNCVEPYENPCCWGVALLVKSLLELSVSR